MDSLCLTESSKALVETIYILTFEVNKYISAARCGFGYQLVLRLITAGTNVTAAGYVTAARKSFAHEECPSIAQVQSIQRLATPPKMKLLVDRSLVQCNRM